MITESIMGFFVDLILFVLDTAIDTLGAPISGAIIIPSPLAWAFTIMITAVTAVVPALFVWWLWRQIKA